MHCCCGPPTSCNFILELYTCSSRNENYAIRIYYYGYVGLIHQVSCITINGWGNCAHVDEQDYDKYFLNVWLLLVIWPSLKGAYFCFLAGA